MNVTALITINSPPDGFSIAASRVYLPMWDNPYRSSLCERVGACVWYSGAIYLYVYIVLVTSECAECVHVARLRRQTGLLCSTLYLHIHSTTATTDGRNNFVCGNVSTVCQRSMESSQSVWRVRHVRCACSCVSVVCVRLWPEDRSMQ